MRLPILLLAVLSLSAVIHAATPRTLYAAGSTQRPATPAAQTQTQPSVKYVLPSQVKKEQDTLDREKNNAMIKSMLATLEKTESGFHGAESPVRQPDGMRYMKELVKGLKGIRKNINKKPEVPQGSSPEEMMLFQQLYSGLRKSARPVGARRAERPMSSAELGALKGVLDQSNMLGDILESPAQTALHQHAHAQSRTLHRLSHVLEQMNENADEDRQRRNDDMMSVLLHAHLEDPEYHDSLHDHLLAHHLSFATHHPQEFDQHIADHLLYHDLGRHVEEDDNNTEENPFMDITNAIAPQYMPKPIKINQAPAAPAAPAAPVAPAATTQK